MVTAANPPSQSQRRQSGISRLLELGLGLLMALSVAAAIVAKPGNEDGPIQPAPVSQHLAVPTSAASFHDSDVCPCSPESRDLLDHALPGAPTARLIYTTSDLGTPDERTSAPLDGSGGIMREWLGRKARAEDRYGFLNRMTELARDRGRPPR